MDAWGDHMLTPAEHDAFDEDWYFVIEGALSPNVLCGRTCVPPPSRGGLHLGLQLCGEDLTIE